MSEAVNHIDINSNLGDKLKEIKLEYFSDWALIAMEDMDEEAVDRLNARAVSIGSKAIDEINAIHNIRENVAVMGMVVFNLAVSLYLSIDQAMTAMEIEEMFGGGHATD